VALSTTWPGTVGATAQLTTAAGIGSGYVTVLVFDSPKAAADAVPTAKSFLDVLGNAVSRQMPVPHLGSEAYGSHLHFSASKIIGPHPSQYTPGYAELRVVAREGRVMAVMALPLADPESSTVVATIPSVIRYGQDLFRRARALER